MKFEFKVSGSGEKPYSTTFHIESSEINSKCTCPGSFGPTDRSQSLCKHRKAILSGDFSKITNSNKLDLNYFFEWLCANKLKDYIRSYLDSNQCEAYLRSKEGLSTLTEPVKQIVEKEAKKSESSITTNRKIQHTTKSITSNNESDIGYAACIDIETTGIDPKRHKIIELCIGGFKYSRSSGSILGLVEIYNSLQDPLCKIPIDSIAIHGINNQMVHHADIDWATVQRIINNSDFLVAHNYSFEKSFLSKIQNISIDKKWRCSMNMPEWEKNHNQKSKKLELLTKSHNILHIPHRAFGDVLATVHLLGTTSSTTNKPYLYYLICNDEHPLFA